jgi:hypothetical protein
VIWEVAKTADLAIHGLLRIADLAIHGLLRIADLAIHGLFRIAYGFADVCCGFTIPFHAKVSRRFRQVQQILAIHGFTHLAIHADSRVWRIQQIQADCVTHLAIHAIQSDSRSSQRFCGIHGFTTAWSIRERPIGLLPSNQPAPEHQATSATPGEFQSWPESGTRQLNLLNRLYLRAQSHANRTLNLLNRLYLRAQSHANRTLNLLMRRLLAVSLRLRLVGLSAHGSWLMLAVRRRPRCR